MRNGRLMIVIAAVATASCSAGTARTDSPEIMAAEDIDRALVGRTPECRAVAVEWMQMRHSSRSLWLTRNDLDDLDRQIGGLGTGGCMRILAQRRHVAELAGQ